MFSTSKRTEQTVAGIAGGPNVTIIARGVRLEGDFSSQGDVVIDGEVQGHVTTSGTLTIGPDAKLKADVSANEATIAGVLQGNLHIKKQLELKSTAQLIGDVMAETIRVEAGAILQGKTTIGTADKKSDPVKKETVHASSETVVPIMQ